MTEHVRPTNYRILAPFIVAGVFVGVAEAVIGYRLLRIVQLMLGASGVPEYLIPVLISAVVIWAVLAPRGRARFFSRVWLPHWLIFALASGMFWAGGSHRWSMFFFALWVLVSLVGVGVGLGFSFGLIKREGEADLYGKGPAANQRALGRSLAAGTALLGAIVALASFALAFASARYDAFLSGGVRVSATAFIPLWLFFIALWVAGILSLSCMDELLAMTSNRLGRPPL